mmetsp:Transcript_11449/g.33752  ORF Transcript_11449/g.33752 Transcript_11449/m.33752 type:complete len:220 (+) Transcript_11449:418-1077(+)
MTSWAFPIVSHALRKSGTDTLAMKSEVVTSRSSNGYSSSKPTSPSSSPVVGSTCMTEKCSSQANVDGDRGLSTFLCNTVKQFSMSPYLICSAAISPATSNTTESASIWTVTLSSLWSSMVFWTWNCSTTCSSQMCLMHRTTYSASGSVSSTGGLVRKTRPSPASSGMAYMTAAGSTFSLGSSRTGGSNAPAASFSSTMPDSFRSSAAVSSTTGREEKVS